MSFTARRGGYESFSGSPPAQFSLATTRTGIPMSSSDQFYKEVPPFATGSPATQFSPGTTKTGIPVSASDQFYKEIPPFHTQPKPKTRLPWSTGLFDCFSDWRTCCMTCWCPCVTFGRIAEIVDKGSSACGVNGALYALLACVTGCCCCYSCFYRTKMRQQHMLQEGPCPDCCLHCFCEYCALCQEYRELTSRGFDLPIGWHGNLEKQSREVPLPPVVEEGMSR